jgi:hypothetical protein
MISYRRDVFGDTSLGRNCTIGGRSHNTSKFIIATRLKNAIDLYLNVTKLVINAIFKKIGHVTLLAKSIC